MIVFGFGKNDLRLPVCWHMRIQDFGSVERSGWGGGSRARGEEIIELADVVLSSEFIMFLMA